MAYLTGVINDNGKMFLYSGAKITGNAVTNEASMLIFDTINFSIVPGDTAGAASPRQFYDAVVLSNNTIIYIGKHQSIFKNVISYLHIF